MGLRFASFAIQCSSYCGQLALAIGLWLQSLHRHPVCACHRPLPPRFACDFGAIVALQFRLSSSPLTLVARRLCPRRCSCFQSGALFRYDLLDGPVLHRPHRLCAHLILVTIVKVGCLSLVLLFWRLLAFKALHPHLLDIHVLLACGL
eukprot:1206125-Amphidinium_carterae.1